MSAPDPNSPTSVTVEQMLGMINTLIATTNNMVVAVNAASQQQQHQYLTLAQQFAEMNKNLIQIDKTVGMGFQDTNHRVVPLEAAKIDHSNRLKDLEDYTINATATIEAHKTWGKIIVGLCSSAIISSIFFIYDARTKLPQIEKQVDEIRENMRHDYSERKGKNETR